MRIFTRRGRKGNAKPHGKRAHRPTLRHCTFEPLELRQMLANVNVTAIMTYQNLVGNANLDTYANFPIRDAYVQIEDVAPDGGKTLLKEGKKGTFYFLNGDKK